MQAVVDSIEEYVLMEADNIVEDMEHKGMLKQALDHFLAKEFEYPKYPATIDGEEKDLITECTADEFRYWMRLKGLDLTFMSDRTLDADDIKFRHRIRYAFLLDLKAITEGP